jgi:hypothetical protein
MITRKPKTLSDFPQFTVGSMRRGKTSATGYTRFELDGKFDRIVEEIDPSWFWLLFAEQDCLCATLQSLERDTGAATLTCDEKDEPKVIGLVLDPNWGWAKKPFRAVDALATDYEANETSIVAGREVRVWTKLEPVGNSRGLSRYYPASDQTFPASSEPRLVHEAWDHEHCDLCKNHIDSGNLGYCDPRDRWMCEKCYERYVVQRDLAFVVEL